MPRNETGRHFLSRDFQYVRVHIYKISLVVCTAVILRYLWLAPQKSVSLCGFLKWSRDEIFRPIYNLIVNLSGFFHTVNAFTQPIENVQISNSVTKITLS